MENVTLILVLTFPTGLLLLGIAHFFENSNWFPEKLGAIMILSGLGMVWIPIIAGGTLFIGYDIILRLIALKLGYELPSIFF